MATAARSTVRKSRKPTTPSTNKARKKPRTVAPRPVSRANEARLAGAADDSSSLVKQTVKALRQRILAKTGENSFLGSEESLIKALGVSRPTFRQAARLLEHEQLLTIKRGIGGGFFARPPSAEGVSRLAAIFLNSQGTTLRQLNDACSPMLIEAVRLIVQNPNRAARNRIWEYVQQHSDFEDSGDPKLYARVALEFEKLLGETCGNPAVSLMISTMRDLVRDPRHGYFRISRERAKVYADFNRRIAEAILDGDGDMAMLIVRRHIAEIESWLPENSRRPPA